MKNILFAAVIGLLGILGMAGPGFAASAPAVAILAGGCFWCVEHDFSKLAGVTDVISGYSGGTRLNPTYRNHHDVDSANPVAHVEVVQITYDPAVLSYDKLLDYYFRHIDPTDGGGQFCDRGPPYRPVIFVGNDQERSIAEAKTADVANRIGQPVAVEILSAGAFWSAEDYHQDYAVKNPVRYKYYRWNCGRDKRIENVWSSMPS